MTRAEQHRQWLESFGFSAEDWARIRRLAASADRHITPQALDDLSVPVRVGAYPPNEASRFSGRPLGSYRGRALLYWPMTERERQEWSRRRVDLPRDGAQHI